MLEYPPGTRLIEKYLRLPRTTRKEFWSEWKIEHIRRLASGDICRDSPFIPASERGSRLLDRLELVRSANPLDTSEIDTTMRFCGDGSNVLSAPLYLGDMSFGSLSGTPNVAIAEAARITGIMAGTGEGGLHPDIPRGSHLTVQWASARFGVDLHTLGAGAAVVIKIGQGAKPGIGGHLPGIKVTQPISETRRVPRGVDAISPAPHHDIYSIEDLGQRIDALKQATGKPVLVKVAATNYIPYIASGIARMGAAGVIIDGAGAGTGAAPTAIRDNVGLPIELAVAATDSVLRREGLREGFTVIASGRVSHPEDSVKLMALGADMTSLGTAPLLALGCLMVRKCHLGHCPAALTNMIGERQLRAISLDWSVLLLKRFVEGWTAEMREIMAAAGARDAVDLTGSRSILRGIHLNGDTSGVLGVDVDECCGCNHLEREDIIQRWQRVRSSGTWRPSAVAHIEELAGVNGRNAGETHMSSMGNSSPPFVELPDRIADFIVSDGAQVTRPSIDPYREEIETEAFVGREGIRLSAPFYFSPLPAEAPQAVCDAVAVAASRMGLLFDPGSEAAVLPSRVTRRTIARLDTVFPGMERAVRCLPGSSVLFLDSPRGRSLFLKFPSTASNAAAAAESAGTLLSAGISSLVVDEDLPSSDIPLEMSVSLLDSLLAKSGQRYSFSLLAQGSYIRGSGDIFKLKALGADAVGMSYPAVIASGILRRDAAVSRETLVERIENMVSGITKEIRLFAGAAGISDISSSLTSSRELLRSVELDPAIRQLLSVKPAGSF